MRASRREAGGWAGWRTRSQITEVPILLGMRWEIRQRAAWSVQEMCHGYRGREARERLGEAVPMAEVEWRWDWMYFGHG